MRYRTIVADPPWDHSDGTGFGYGEKRIPATFNGRLLPAGKGAPRSTAPPYRHMTLTQIADLPVPELAEQDAHVYLWTTQRYLRASFDILDGWGFSVSATLTWCKAPMGFMGGAYRSSTEFCHFAKAREPRTQGAVADVVVHVAAGRVDAERPGSEAQPQTRRVP